MPKFQVNAVKTTEYNFIIEGETYAQAEAEIAEYIDADFDEVAGETRLNEWKIEIIENPCPICGSFSLDEYADPNQREICVDCATSL